MAELLVADTSVLIDYQRQHPSARRILGSLFNKRAAAVHPVSAAELLDGVLDRGDQRRTVEFIATLKLLTVKPVDFGRCLSLMSDVHLSHGIGWADCLIAATRVRLELPLLTRNDKHFKAIRGLRVVRPY